MNTFESSQPYANKYPFTKTLDFRVKYKTQVIFMVMQKCRYWENEGVCPYGLTCTFVHSENEMRCKGQIHEHYKTKPCLNFLRHGYCKYGDRCLFQHTDQDNDRDRTRSNSPNDSLPPPKISNRHRQNLKLLAQYGFSVFKALINRPHSKIVKQIEMESSNTLPQYLNGSIYIDNYLDEDWFVVQSNLRDKKIRMYSI